MAENQFPTEIIDLPSQGWYYPEGHPLASGKIEVYYMTAKHEDILTSRNLIQRGVVIDKLMEALIVPGKGVNYDDLLIGDKNGLMVAARVMGYGKDYRVTVSCPACEKEGSTVVNLEDINDKKVEFLPTQKGKNEFQVTLPASKKTISFKLLTHKDERDVQTDLDALKKLKLQVTPEVTTRMKKAITAVDGVSDFKVISKFVDAMPVRDAAAFREAVSKVNPDIDLSFNYTCDDPECGHQSRLEVPIDVNFFWPDSGV